MQVIIQVIYNIFAVQGDEFSLLGRLPDSWKERYIYTHIYIFITAINLQAGRIITRGKSYTFLQKAEYFSFSFA